MGTAAVGETAFKPASEQETRRVIDYLTASAPEIAQMARSNPDNKMVIAIEQTPDPVAANPIERQYYRVYVGFNVEDGGPGHRSRWATFLVNSSYTDILWQNYLVDEAYIPLADWQKYIFPNRKQDENDWICIPLLRVGPIDATSSITDLSRVFGAQNVSRRVAYGPEGIEKYDVTVVYGGTTDEMIVYWQDNLYGARPERVSFRHPQGRWRTIFSIKPGTGIAELNRINGRPFEFMGFGWDYGGNIVNNWSGGALAVVRGLTVKLATNRELPREYYGDRYLKSDLPLLQTDAAAVERVDVQLR
jgi:hypothetical protein